MPPTRRRVRGAGNNNIMITSGIGKKAEIFKQ
jgi:hypothetical protein